jgi:sulfur-carrier protein
MNRISEHCFHPVYLVHPVNNCLCLPLIVSFIGVDRAAETAFGADMAIKVQIPTPMREQAGGKAEVEVTGGTVKAAFDDLLRQYPALGAKLFDNGKLRPYINVFVNDEDIRYLDEMDTAITDGVIVALIPAVAGG